MIYGKYCFCNRIISCCVLCPDSQTVYSLFGYKPSFCIFQSIQKHLILIICQIRNGFFNFIIPLKKGKICSIELIHISDYRAAAVNNKPILFFRLPASPVFNLNPAFIMTILFKYKWYADFLF